MGDFEYVEDTSSDGVLVRVYTPPGKKEHGKFALFVASKVLPFFREYFQIAYPLPKMDLVAVSEMAASNFFNVFCEEVSKIMIGRVESCTAFITSVLKM